MQLVACFFSIWLNPTLHSMQVNGSENFRESSMVKMNCAIRVDEVCPLVVMNILALFGVGDFIFKVVIYGYIHNRSV